MKMCSDWKEHLYHRAKYCWLFRFLSFQFETENFRAERYEDRRQTQYINACIEIRFLSLLQRWQIYSYLQLDTNVFQNARQIGPKICQDISSWQKERIHIREVSGAHHMTFASQMNTHLLFAHLKYKVRSLLPCLMNI